MSMNGFLMVHWQLKDWKTALAGDREREEKKKEFQNLFMYFTQSSIKE